MFATKLALPFLLLLASTSLAAPSAEQLAKWLKKFPQADTNKDGTLTAEEAQAFQKNASRGKAGAKRGVKRDFKVDPGWQADRFPDHAICHRSPDEIKEVYAKLLGRGGNPVTSFDKPENGALRIVGTGHSFMAPGYKTLPLICKAAGFDQPLCLHTGGGMTGSARYKWEQENGIFQFDRKPQPKLLSSIANAEWEAMVWGPYFNDRPEYYQCWIDFCLKYHPEMKFFLSDAWPQVGQLDEIPASEAVLTAETITRLGREKHARYAELVDSLNAKYDNRIFILPTCDAMVLAAQHFHRGELPGVEGINRAIGGKERSLWRDQLGHLGPGFERLEGYVFYATLYGRSPMLLKDDVFGVSTGFPSEDLDRTFRKIAWQAVIGNRLSGVTDKDRNGIGDPR